MRRIGITSGSTKGAPSAPTGVSASAGSGQATVTFTASSFSKLPITSYTVTSSPGSITASGASSPITVSGLTNGTAYTFTVTATNANGTSASSSSSGSVTPIDPTFMASISYSGGTMQYTTTAADSAGNIYIGYQIIPYNVSSAYGYNVIQKLSSSGTTSWTQPYSYYYASSTAGQSYSQDLFVDSSNNPYIVGTQYAIDATFSSIPWANVAKLDSSTGNISWQTVLYKYNIGGSPNYSYGNSITQDSSGNTYFAGGLDYDIDNLDMSIAKLNSSGTYQWSIQYQRPSGTGNGDSFYSIAIDSSSNLYATGHYTVQTFISKGNYAYTQTYMVQKTDINGSQVWCRGFSDYSYNASSSTGNAIVTDSSNNIYSIGGTNRNNSNQGFVAKWNSSGTIQWHKLLNDPANGYTSATSIAIDSSDNIYVLFQAISSPSYSTIVKYNSSGTIQWQRKLIVNANETYPGGITVSGNNLIVVGRYLSNVPSNYYGTWVIKVPTDGSKTGTYSVGSLSYVYSSGSLSEYTGNLTETSVSLTATSRTVSSASGTLSSRTASVTPTTTSI